MNDTILIAGILVFIAGFMAVEGLYLWWKSHRSAEARRLHERMRDISEGRSAAGGDALWKRRAARLLDEDGLPVGARNRIERLLFESGSDWTPQYLLGVSLLAGACVALFAAIFRMPWIAALVLGSIAALAPLAMLSLRRERRRARFDDLLPDALDMIGRALRAGHSFPSALKLAGEELPSPIGEEFRQTFDEINFGVAPSTALQNLAQRVPSDDIKFFVIAVLIQRESGGNLSEILDGLAAIVRDRAKLFGKIRAISAEGRYSAVVLTLLPFFTAFVLYLVNEPFVSLLWKEPGGIKMIYAGLVAIAIGALWMRRVIRIHV